VAEKLTHRGTVQATNFSLAVFSCDPLFQVVIANANSRDVGRDCVFQVRQIGWSDDQVFSHGAPGHMWVSTPKE